jgi:hypothetical protein
MKKRILLVGVMILTGAISAFGQAAAESVMIHSMSAGAGAKAGTSLGRSTNNAASALGGRLGSTMSSTLSSRPSPSRHATVRPAVPPPAGTKAPVPCAQPDPKQPGQTQVGTNTKPDCQTPTHAEPDKTKYKKFVTLTFDNK